MALCQDKRAHSTCVGRYSVSVQTSAIACASADRAAYVVPRTQPQVYLLRKSLVQTVRNQTGERAFSARSLGCDRESQQLHCKGGVLHLTSGRS
eukprot:1847873-Rhodomonas_salina.2